MSLQGVRGRARGSVTSEVRHTRTAGGAITVAVMALQRILDAKHQGVTLHAGKLGVWTTRVERAEGEQGEVLPNLILDEAHTSVAVIVALVYPAHAEVEPVP